MTSEWASRTGQRAWPVSPSRLKTFPAALWFQDSLLCPFGHGRRTLRASGGTPHQLMAGRGISRVGVRKEGLEHGSTGLMSERLESAVRHCGKPAVIMNGFIRA